MLDLVIQNQSGKGRAFAATLLAHVLAPQMWAGGQSGGDVIRPIWMMLAGSDASLRPFVANLQTGRKAELSSSRSRSKTSKFEVLKSAGFRFTWQRTNLGSVVTCFLPSPFQLDPGMVDTKGVEFILLPGQDWLVEPDPKAAAYLAQIGVPKDAADLVLPLAPVFIAFLDRRTRCPIIPDARFYAQVLYQALTQGLASWSLSLEYFYRDPGWGQHKKARYHEVSTEDVGLAKGLAFQASHEIVESFLAEQVKFYFEQVRRG